MSDVLAPSHESNVGALQRAINHIRVWASSLAAWAVGKLY